MKRSSAVLILSWAVVVAYSGLIFYLSSLSFLRLHLGGWELPDIPGFDKVEHFGAYTLWVLLFSASRRLSWPGMATGPGILFSTAAGTLYGASDEFHQRFVPGRTCDLWDLAADAAGSLAGACFHAAWSRRRARARSKTA
jgi:VanZ family protein